MDIQNEVEYNKVIEEIWHLIDNPDDTEEQQNRLDWLVQAVYDYDEIHYPTPLFDKGDEN